MTKAPDVTATSMPDDALVVELLLEALVDPSRTPRFERMERALADATRAGRLPTGSILPPEPALAARVGVSRQTVNRALARLARRGLVTRRRGVGTFIAAPVIEQPLGALYSVIRNLEAQGREPGTRLLTARDVHDHEAALLLTGQSEALVFAVRRVRLVDGEPLVLEDVFLPRECGARLPRARLEHEVLYDLLRDVCGVVVTHAEETLRPVVVGRADARLLDVPAGDPAMLVERIGYADARVVEVRRSLIRGDRHRFRVQLPGPMLRDHEPPAL